MISNPIQPRRTRRSRRKTPEHFAYFVSFVVFGIQTTNITRHRSPDLIAAIERSDLLIEIRRCNDAVVEVAELELLVRRVRVLVGQTDAEQHARNADLLLERRDHRDRAPLAVEDR